MSLPELARWLVTEQQHIIDAMEGLLRLTSTHKGMLDMARQDSANDPLKVASMEQGCVETAAQIARPQLARSCARKRC